MNDYYNNNFLYVFLRVIDGEKFSSNVERKIKYIPKNEI